IAELLERLAGQLVIAAGGEQPRRLAQALLVARGRDALGLGLGVERAAERARRLAVEVGLVAGPVERVAQGGDRGGAIAGARRSPGSRRAAWRARPWRRRARAPWPARATPGPARGRRRSPS